MSDGGVSGGLGPALFIGLSIYVFVAGGDDGMGPNPARTMDMDAAQVTSLFSKAGMPMSVIGSLDPPLLGAAQKARPARAPSDLRERLLVYQVPVAPTRPETTPHRAVVAPQAVVKPAPLPRITLWQGPVLPPLPLSPLIVTSPRAAEPLPDWPLIFGVPDPLPSAAAPVADYRPAPSPTAPAKANKPADLDPEASERAFEEPLSITVTVQGQAVFLRAGPSADSGPLGQFDTGDEAELLDVEGDWSRLNFPFADPPLTGWMFSSFLSVADGS